MRKDISILEAIEPEGLMHRRIVTTKPIQAYYSLTDKGVKVAIHLDKIKKKL